MKRSKRNLRNFSHLVSTCESIWMTFVEGLLKKMRQRHFLLTILWINQVFTLDYCTNKKSEENENEPRYEFKYGVRDSDTGDVKSHWEFRNGDNVEGAYSLLEADGTTRIVQYSADGRRGFNAIVSKEHKSKPLTPLNPYYQNNFENILPEKQKHISGAHSHFSSNKLRPIFPQPTSKQNKIVLQNQNPENSENFKRDSNWVPTNHKPVYTKIRDHAKLVNMYNFFRGRQSKIKIQKFDYGINEYFANKQNRSGFMFTTRTV